MSNLSILILTKNEEENIASCLKSCSFAREIIVVDDASIDNTVQIAEGLGAKVFHRQLDGDFGAQKTFAIQQATSDWVFILDADERFTPQLVEEVKELVEREPNECFAVRRQNHFKTGKATHGVLRPDWVVRLMPREGSIIQGKVHEKLETSLPVNKLEGLLIHYPYKDWHSYLTKFDKYTTLAAEGYFKSGKRCSFIRDILFRPFWAFLKVYIFNRGFLDGKLGFIFSVNHYFYTLMKYVKLNSLEKGKGRI